eukprot:jgi/Tetstr1/443833/TSEL_003287.t1
MGACGEILRLSPLAMLLAWVAASPVEAAITSAEVIRLASSSAADPRARAARVAGDGLLSFFTASDIHLGWDPNTQPSCPNSTYNSFELNRLAVDAMNHLPGEQDWEEAMGGGPVVEPAGLVVSGDLVDRGPEAIGYPQMVNFTNLYGLDGEGMLRYPVYEGFGNHDGGNLTSGPHYPNYVRLGIKARNKVRRGVMHLSDNELHYSWDWPITPSCSLHLVQLNLFAGRYGEPVDAPFYGPNPASWVHPEYSLDFLERDLAANVGDSGRPVVFFQHYGFDGFSNSWWADHEREELAQVLAPYNVLAIFVGHTHAANYYQWNGYDVINTPSTQADATWRGPPDPQYMVVEVTSEDGGASGKLRVGQRKRYAWGPVKFQKEAPLCGKLPPSPHPTSAPRKALGKTGQPVRDINRITGLFRPFPPPPANEMV